MNHKVRLIADDESVLRGWEEIGIHRYGRFKDSRRSTGFYSGCVFKRLQDEYHKDTTFRVSKLTVQVDYNSNNGTDIFKIL